MAYHMAIILQYTNVSNEHINLNFTQFYVKYISLYRKRKILNAIPRKTQITCRVIIIRSTVTFSLATIADRKSGLIIF